MGRELGPLKGDAPGSRQEGEALGPGRAASFSCLILRVPEVRSEQLLLCEHLEMEAGPQGTLNPQCPALARTQRQHALNIRLMNECIFSLVLGGRGRQQLRPLVRQALC